MSWNICDLDKTKTELSIASENARLDACRVELDKLKNEYEREKYECATKLSILENKIIAIKSSIASGEKFVEDCKKHLNELN